MKKIPSTLKRSVWNKYDGEYEIEVYVCSYCSKEYKTIPEYEQHEKNCSITKSKVLQLNPPKKKRIPATLKRLVWNKYIGENIGKSKCLCCRLTDITQLSFHCGHIISEFNSGTTDLENLRPICQNCNSSMGTTNMDDFIHTFKLHSI